MGTMLREKRIETWVKSEMDIKNRFIPFPMTDRDMKQYQESRNQATVPIPCVRILLPHAVKTEKSLFTPSTTTNSPRDHAKETGRRYRRYKWVENAR
jgi:hypothetical protein